MKLPIKTSPSLLPFPFCLMDNWIPKPLKLQSNLPTNNQDPFSGLGNFLVQTLLSKLNQPAR